MKIMIITSRIKIHLIINKNILNNIGKHNNNIMPIIIPPIPIKGNEIIIPKINIKNNPMMIHYYLNSNFVFLIVLKKVVFLF